MLRYKTLQDMFKRYRRPGDLVFAVAFLVFALILLGLITDQTVWKKGTKLFAQPRFWPAVSLTCMAVFGAFHLLGSLVSPRIDGRWQEVGFWLKAFEYVLWFLAYVAVVPVIGYLLATTLFTVILAVRLGYRSGRWVAISATTAFVIVVIFKSFLQVRIPGGQIYEVLPTTLRSFMLTYF